MTTATDVYRIQCAEIWGGISAKEDEIATPGVRAAIHSSAAGGSQGGDLYYFSVCAYDTLTRLAIADVRGHGPAVSQLSAWLYESLEAHMNEADGARVLSDLNEIVRRRGFEALTTAAVATLHRDKGILHYASAGHPPLLLRRGNEWQTLEPQASTVGPANLPLGAMPGARYVQNSVTIAPADRVFAYTDGVLECPAPDSTSDDPELFGDRRMLGTLDRVAHLPLAEAREHIRHDLTAHAGGSLEHDDCTFLLVEVLQPPPFWKRRILPGRARVLSM